MRGASEPSTSTLAGAASATDPLACRAALAAPSCRADLATRMWPPARQLQVGISSRGRRLEEMERRENLLKTL